MTNYEGTARMQDGRKLPFAYDQRDIAKLEASSIDPGHLVTGVRFVAWSSLVRAKTISMDWATFNETECVECEDAEASEGDERLDPGRPVQSGES